MTVIEEARKPYASYSGRSSRCPKCGGEVDAGRWQSAGTVFVGPAADGGAICGYGKGPEWMLRECVDCGYCWPEELPGSGDSSEAGRGKSVITAADWDPLITALRTVSPRQLAAALRQIGVEPPAATGL